MASIVLTNPPAICKILCQHGILKKWSGRFVREYEREIDIVQDQHGDLTNCRCIFLEDEQRHISRLESAFASSKQCLDAFKRPHGSSSKTNPSAILNISCQMRYTQSSREVPGWKPLVSRTQLAIHHDPGNYEEAKIRYFLHTLKCQDTPLVFASSSGQTTLGVSSPDQLGRILFLQIWSIQIVYILIQWQVILLG